MSKRNIAEEIRIDYHNNTNMDRLTCKQTFSSSDNDFLMDIGFEKIKLPTRLTIWYKTYNFRFNYANIAFCFQNENDIYIFLYSFLCSKY